jgi:glycosyltransferase involved in cell wall biosynthesis
MLNKPIQISVLMPIFNPNIKWLGATLESLNQQTVHNWQLVLSLDGDDKATVRAVTVARETLRPSQTLVVVRGPRGGISEALNRGLAACNTPYTARLDADDICRPDRLEIQWKRLESEPDLVGCGMQIQAIDTDGKEIQGRIHTYPTSRDATLLVGALFNTPIAHPVLMFRTFNAVEIGGYRNKRCMEDYDIMARLSEHGNLINLAGTGLNYRIHNNQHSRQARPKRGELLQARLKFLKVLTKKQYAAVVLIVFPLALYVIGPKGEYQLRRLASHLGSTVIGIQRSRSTANSSKKIIRE